MIRQAWIAVGLAALLVGCGGAGGGSGLGDKTGASGGTLTSGSTSGSGSTGGTVGATSGSTSGSGSTAGSTAGSGATGGSTGSTAGSSSGDSSAGSTSGSTGGSSTGGTLGTTGGSSTGSTGGDLGTTGGDVTIVVGDEPVTTTGGGTGGSSDSGGTTGSSTDGGSTGSTTDGGTTGDTTGSTTGGSTGDTTGGTTGGDSTGGGPVGDWGHSNAVLLKVYEVDLMGPAGDVMVFSDPNGMLIDIKRLRDKQGPRFMFLNRKSIPLGSYTGARVVVDEVFTSMVGGLSKGVSKQFVSGLRDGYGHAILSYTFANTVTVGYGSSTVVVNFNLDKWQDNHDVVTPHLKQGKANGLNDPSRMEHSKVSGQVSNLIFGNSFKLKHDANSTFTVGFSATTQVIGGSTKNTKNLANGQQVLVDGYWDAMSGKFMADSVKVQSSN